MSTQDRAGMETGRIERWYTIYGVSICVSSASKSALDRLGYLQKHFHDPSPPPVPVVDYRLDCTPHGQRSLILRKKGDDEPLFQCAEEDEMAAFLEKSINYSVLSTLKNYLIVHAGVVQRNGYGLILPARSGNGKSLLVLGLLLSGYKFLSDDVALIDQKGKTVLPFPTSLCFKRDAKPLLNRCNLYPGPRNSFVYRGKPIYYFNPHEIDPRSIGETCPLQQIVFPHFEPSVDAELKKISKVEAAFRLVQNSFNFGSQEENSLDALAGLVEETDCFELRFGELEAGVRAITGMIAGN